MPRRKTQFANGEFYHIILRSVGDIEIFKDESDYYRAIFSLYEFNNFLPVNIWHRRQQRRREKKFEKNLLAPTLQNLKSLTDFVVPTRDLLVEIYAFAIMPNHIHLLVKQIKDNGISLFMQKFGGLASYFNKKHNRKGHLFCTFRSVHIKTDQQLRSVFVYIHCNPLSLIEPGWKENGIKNAKKAVVFLEKYRWSSYLDYVGIKNFPSIILKDFMSGTMGGEKGSRDSIEDWIKFKSKLDFSEVDIE